MLAMMSMGAVEDGSQADLAVDLVHALEVGLRCTLGSEDDVLDKI